MNIKWTDMPSSLWKVWFVVSKMRLLLLGITILSGFAIVFAVPDNSTSFVILAMIAGTGLLLVGLQQLFDIRYARRYLFPSKLN